MDVLKDLFRFIFQRKKFWLLPAMIILIFLGILLFLSAGSALSPFIYTIF